MNEVKNDIRNITGLATTSAFAAVENKIPSVTNLVKKLIMIQKLVKLKQNSLIILMINILPPQNLIS